jgi:hypothetical protein
MLRRRTRIAIYFVVATAVAGAIWWLVYGDIRPGRYSRWNYEKIRDGMTLREVEALLGGPGEDASRYAWYSYKPNTLSESGDKYRGWRPPSGSGGIVVGFDREGRVCGKSMFEPSP